MHLGRNIYFIWKGYWKSCVIISERLDMNYCQVQGWKFCARLYQTPNILLEGHEILCMKIIVLIWKSNAQSRYTIWFMISWKISHGARFFTMMHTYTKKSRRGIYRQCVPEFPSFTALKLRQEFQNIEKTNYTIVFHLFIALSLPPTPVHTPLPQHPYN